MERITSLQNERVKKAIKLRDRKGRDKQTRIVIDGVREITRALEANVELVEVFTCESLVTTAEATQLLSQIEDENCVRLEVTEAVWEKLTFGHRRDGILAVATPPAKSLEDLPRSENAFIVVLDGVEKPGNVGAVVRTADGAGADAVVLTNPATDTYNPNAIRASLGTIFSMPVVSADASVVFDFLQTRNVAIVVSIVNEAAKNYAEADLRGSVAIVFGSEAKGVGDFWKAQADLESIYLPMHGKADSLNVSAATAAVLYEVVRQRA